MALLKAELVLIMIKFVVCGLTSTLRYLMQKDFNRDSQWFRGSNLLYFICFWIATLQDSEVPQFEVT